MYRIYVFKSENLNLESWFSRILLKRVSNFFYLILSYVERKKKMNNFWYSLELYGDVLVDRSMYENLYK